ncbi:MAG: hypothetical protein CME64_14110 [Halobacteriovoraceae bacterium]|nr:hypothetical protein [Halobacteriovoraceae bacterium]|tara:strand:- start:30511 stop:30963 length:453 start_codon:yes stop_codon:yes gene_type:complete
MSLLKVLIVISFLLGHNQALSLISADKMSAQILTYLDKNVLSISRGLEDGIVKGDHMKLTNDYGFIARGICLKAAMGKSYWKIYRVVRPELVSKDSLYTLHAINQSEIPRDLKKFKEVDFRKFIPEESEQEAIKRQQDFIMNYDLPEVVD